MTEKLYTRQEICQVLREARDANGEMFKNKAARTIKTADKMIDRNFLKGRLYSISDARDYLSKNLNRTEFKTIASILDEYEKASA